MLPSGMPARKLIESEVSLKSEARSLFATLTSKAVRSEPNPVTRLLAVVLVRHVTGAPGGPPLGGDGGVGVLVGRVGGAGAPGRWGTAAARLARAETMTVLAKNFILNFWKMCMCWMV